MAVGVRLDELGINVEGIIRVCQVLCVVLLRTMMVAIEYVGGAA